MRTFLFRLTRFGVLLGAFFALNLLAHRALRTRYASPVRDTTRTLILGDSHIQAAVNPDSLEAAVNVGSSGEPLMITYYKLRKILDQHPSIETVVLGFGPHNLARYNDRKVRDAPWANEILGRYTGVVPWKEMSGVEIDRRALLLTPLKRDLLPNYELFYLAVALVQKETRRYPYDEGFLANTGNEIQGQTPDRTLERHYPDGEAEEPSEIQLDYLRRIVELARERGLGLVLLSAPLHPAYRSRIPETLTAAHARTLEEASDIPGVTALDLTDLPLEPGQYRDFDHVNAFGADVVAGRLRAVLSGRG